MEKVSVRFHVPVIVASYNLIMTSCPYSHMPDLEKTVISDDPHDYSALVAILAAAKFHNLMVAFAKERDTNF